MSQQSDLSRFIALVRRGWKMVKQQDAGDKTEDTVVARLAQRES
jgi:hypothetical protein